MREATAVEQAGERRIASVESLRALAALGVVVGHVYGAHVGYGAAAYDTFVHRAVLGGGFGVWIFFALTGYLLFRPWAERAWGDGPSVALGGYLRNRALRVLPLYFVVLVVVLLLQERGGSWGQWWRFGLGLENFSTATVAKVDGPMWSLVVEVHFYLLLPLLALGLGRLPRAAAAAVLVAAGLASFVLRDGAVDPRLVYSLPTTFGFFVPGLLLALARAGRRDPPALPRALQWADVWLLLALVPLLASWWRYDWVPLMALCGGLAVGACVLPLRRGPLARALQWRPLAVLGVASYSLYLWHGPIVARLDRTSLPGSFLGRLAVALPVCCAVALISYTLVERPFLRRRRPWADRLAAPPAAPPVVPRAPELV